MTGVGLAGLSFLDPTMANHPELLSSMLFCTIVGSNAPDINIIEGKYPQQADTFIYLNALFLFYTPHIHPMTNSIIQLIIRVNLRY